MRKRLLQNKVLLIVATMVLLFSMSACGSQPDKKQNKGQKSDTSKTTAYPTDVKKKPIITITMKGGGKITAELYPKVAPNTVANFISLIQKGFYDGLTFHRVIPGFMIQGGDPKGDGSGGPGYSIKGEFSSNGFKNDLKHTRGVLSMARTQDPNSAGSQFFIMVAASPQLDGKYAAFGKVTDGMDIVDHIVSVPRGAQNKPVDDQIMKTVTVNTQGYHYPKPTKVK